MREETYWLWLSMALGQGKNVDNVLEMYPDPKELYFANRMSRAISGAFSNTQMDRLESLSLNDCENMLEICVKNGWGFAAVDSDKYPRSLTNLKDKPLILFYEGDFSLLNDSLAIGIVGTRNPCMQSIKAAKSLSFDLATAGALIVSGGALGIDSAAHEGALEAGGVTACVLGCGLGTRYLMTNDNLRRRICKNGVLVTEYPPFTPASRITFPLRNRIISGLSEGIVVVEAGEKSGSLITANFALEQGKDVFAVPGDILNAAYTGANKLIRDGARVVTCSEDILDSYAYLYKNKIDLSKLSSKEKPCLSDNKKDKKIAVKSEKRKLPEDFDKTAAAVYELFNENPIHPDDIAASLGLDFSRVSTSLMLLQLAGYIEQGDGKNYNLK